MCEFTPSDPFIAELRAQHHQRTEQRMDNQITFRRPADRKWPSQLSAPVDPLETTLCARAQSLLTGGELGVCPPLPITQARDVLRWAGIAV